MKHAHLIVVIHSPKMLTKLLLVLSCIPILLSLGTLAFPFDHDGVSDEPTLENGLRKYIVVFKTDISRDDSKYCVQ